MKLTITRQDYYSRAELILRALFGWIYIGIPHAFLLFFFFIWGAILRFIAFWSILFTGRYPESFFEFQTGLYKWENRVNARLWNLSDDYPAFFPDGEDEFTNLEIQYPENLSRGHLLLKVFLGFFYCALPHAFVLFFRTIWSYILAFLAFWVVLFTAEYPEEWHDFNVGTLRWSLRVNLYMGFMTDEYPPFSGRERVGDEKIS